jgi:hypothetical protein
LFVIATWVKEVRSYLLLFVISPETDPASRCFAIIRPGVIRAIEHGKEK